MMLTVTSRGLNLLSQRAEKGSDIVSIDEVVLAAIAERGPIEDDVLEDLIPSTRVPTAINRLQARGLVGLTPSE